MKFFDKVKKRSDEIEDAINLAKNYGHYTDMFFDNIMDTVETVVARACEVLKADIYKVLYSTAISAGVKPKDIAKNYTIEKLEKFQSDLLTEVKARVEKEKELLEKKSKSTK